MGVAEAIGGAALVGLGLLVGLAVLDDGEPETLQSSQATVEASPSTTTGTTAAPSTGATASGTNTTSWPVPESTAAPTVSQPTSTSGPAATSEPTASTIEVLATAGAPSDSTTTTASRSTDQLITAPPRTVTRPLDRSEVAVQVLNAGAPAGAAAAMTEQLEVAGFRPLPAADAAEDIAWTTIIYTPGSLEGARAVGQTVGLDERLVIEAPPGDPRWPPDVEQLDVLVLVASGQD